MTPTELLVLFSSYIFTFLLIRFANIADSVGETKSEAAGGEQEESVPAVHGMADWNVAAFFGLRSHPSKLLPNAGKPD
jgi:hypothetical protein